MDRNKEMYEFLKQYPDAYGVLNFIFSQASDGNTSFIPVTNDRVIKTDILGTKTKAYIFAIAVYKSYSPDVPGENLDNINAVQDFMKWIDEQEAQRNYPKFANATVVKIENLQNIPGASGIDEQMRLAKYMFQCKVTYKEK